MKKPILLTTIALTLLCSSAIAADTKASDSKSSSKSTHSQSIIITRGATNGQAAGTVTVTIDKDGKKQVKSWQIGGLVNNWKKSQTSAKKEKVTWLGVAITEISDDLASQFQIPAGAGLRIRQVVEDSPANKAGIRNDDLIYLIDKQIIFNIAQFQSLIKGFKAGREVELTFFRKGKKQTVTAKLLSHETRATSVPFDFHVTSGKGADERSNLNWLYQGDWREMQNKSEIELAKTLELLGAVSRKHSFPADRQIVFTSDGKHTSYEDVTTYVRDFGTIQKDIRKRVEKALTESKVSEPALKKALAAIDQGFKSTR